MGLLGRTSLAAAAACAALALICPSITAQASDTVLQASDSAFGRRVDLIRVDGNNTYTVQPGDSLWAIAQKKLGDGAEYPKLAVLNRDVISDPDLIYPGMVLLLPGKQIWLVNDELQMPCGDYSFAVPVGMYVSCLYIGAAARVKMSANFALTDNDMNFIACLVQDRDDALSDSLADWNGCSRNIRDYAAAQFRDTVSDIVFEQYRTASGEAVYLYSYLYSLDLKKYGQDGIFPISVCLGIHLTDHMQAQFLGVGMDGYDISNEVLITAGSFTELAGAERFPSQVSNTAILPAYSWEIAGMFNPFPWTAQWFDEICREAFDIPDGQDLTEKFMQHGRIITRPDGSSDDQGPTG